MLNNRKRRPTHPGEVLREEILPETRLSQSELARRLGVSRGVVTKLVNERRAVTPDLAHRLARVFNTTPELWLNLQQAVDVWETYAANRLTYTKLKPLGDKRAA
ncbi:MAG: HigA family addiction module antidote protein [Acidobacteria bacterium]|nr:HigA family addiction module antidote protein [Acidobacteriota bacterium]MCA1640518.1 HigA family addiction module antidote protein [Acidobacteriota bacterium]